MFLVVPAVHLSARRILPALKQLICGPAGRGGSPAHRPPAESKVLAETDRNIKTIYSGIVPLLRVVIHLCSNLIYRMFLLKFTRKIETPEKKMSIKNKLF
jgi:hypothetical protein